MADQALTGLKVLEFANLVSGPYCGKMFAELGAEVIKIELPVKGDDARRCAPFAGKYTRNRKKRTFLLSQFEQAGHYP